MNEIDHELELLVRATSRTATPAAPTAEEAELREGWETLTQLAARATKERKLDEAAFLAKVSASVVRPAFATRGRWLVALVALAASIVVAVGAGAYVASLSWVSGNVARGVTPRPDEAPNGAYENPAYEWDDTLDEQIHYLDLTVRQIGWGASTGDRSLEALGVQLEQFENEIENGSL